MTIRRPGVRAAAGRIFRDMRPSEVRRLIKMKPVELNAARRRLAGCHDVGDLRRAGRRIMPRPVFDYVDGGADEELSMAANIRAFRRWRFQPRALVDVSEVDTSAPLLDRAVPLPLALAPTGYTRMMHPDGEIGAARAAQRHGLPYTLSTMATTTIEDVAASAQPDLWFQLYILRDSGLSKELVDRAAAAGPRVLLGTGACFVTGHRRRHQPRHHRARYCLAAGSVAGQAGHQGAARAGRRAAGGLARGGRPAAVQPRRTAARPDGGTRRPDRGGAGGGRTRGAGAR